MFFKWIKEHLRIKFFFGTIENIVKIQIWITVSVCVLVAVIKKRLKLEAKFYTILQVLSVTIFGRLPLVQMFTEPNYKTESPKINNQLPLFDQTLG